MPAPRRFAVAASAALLAAAAATAWSQDPDPQAEGMRKWAAYAAPSKHHALLEKMVGTWDTTWRLWMQPGKPVETKGEAVAAWDLGKRFVVTRAKSSLMGMPTEAVTTWGYDNFRKHYVMSQTSTWATSILHAEGAPERDQSAIHLYGPMDEFLDGTVAKNVRYTMRFPEADRLLLEVHDLDIGEKDTKVIEVEFRRRK